MNRPPLINRLILPLLLLCTFFSASTAWSVTEQPADVANRLQQTYDQLQSLSFTFSQNSQGPFNTQDRLGRGRAVFLRNTETDGKARMRWDYDKPDLQVLISDGETLRMYFARLQQQIITPATALEQDLIYSFFSGRARLDESFEIVAADRPAPPDTQNTSETTAIRLLPKKEQSQISEIRLTISNDSLITGIEITDHFDTRTILTLSNIQPNSLKDLTTADRERLFVFSPPPDTEIIHQ
ncbi:MAG: outer membrane lipoprotein carrier protein LolA [Desulfobulbaceae bacterium]|uniref:Outer membrane lipoprotein carrier protein LolA n=1 Tax=Candidatus Desulfatifera sulfidica TaxID=2841691 RepID=A0A8J6N8W5_9BACT|nr:outer membrane lipoprotein carrier protein LolA [Candidatus Desulfatifera sulfidica]